MQRSSVQSHQQHGTKRSRHRGVPGRDSDTWHASRKVGRSRRSLPDLLEQTASVASVVCVLDCTVLPLVTGMMPLLGFVATPIQLEWLHQVGHYLALFFVIPVGTLVAALNYQSQRRLWPLVLAFLGLALVFGANSHRLPMGNLLPHKLNQGSTHRLLNLIGCCFLLGSNRYSRRPRSMADDRCSCGAGAECLPTTTWQQQWEKTFDKSMKVEPTNSILL